MNTDFLLLRNLFYHRGHREIETDFIAGQFDLINHSGYGA